VHCTKGKHRCRGKFSNSIHECILPSFTYLSCKYVCLHTLCIYEFTFDFAFGFSINFRICMKSFCSFSTSIGRKNKGFARKQFVAIEKMQIKIDFEWGLEYFKRLVLNKYVLLTLGARNFCISIVNKCEQKNVDN
jgi:hypothetical protein